MKRDEARAGEQWHGPRGAQTNEGRETVWKPGDPVSVLITPFLPFSFHSVLFSYGETINSHLS